MPDYIHSLSTRLYYLLIAISFLAILMIGMSIALGSRHTSWYQKYLVMNILYVALLFFFPRKTKQILTRLAEWVSIQDENFYPRKLIFGAILFVLITFQTKIFWGFWFSGIAGWTYENKHSQIREAVELPEASRAIPSDSFLYKSIKDENILFFQKSGYITGNAMFLHYSNGEIWPTNFELSGLVFPQYVFNLESLQEKTYQRSFLEIFSKNLALRKNGRAFLLPLEITYPVHTPYMQIDYTRTPDANLLGRISWWEIVVYADHEENTIKIVDAKELISIEK
ncbi:hypothetical protein XM38_017690 [Halomicronema hongdechloris C2206]|uniref:Uncharacterized protein n=1 Tax=Halomicronema hongdechloris C2206 TaxID=1641165 RepID=A0A1Z3HKH6_9CYAN|nr:hypothetical protein [Halomicronema hongdechloris]ASC70822.1 hypothetical protein XM38_017690 [Halomicronema hongdechloris C2206]